MDSRLHIEDSQGNSLLNVYHYAAISGSALPVVQDMLKDGDGGVWDIVSIYPGLYLFTTMNRMMRPVRNLALGKQELIGTLEQLYMNIAITETDILSGVTSHQELFPHAMLSVVANFIPYSDHNQSPRNMYQCQMEIPMVQKCEFMPPAPAPLPHILICSILLARGVGKQTMGFPLYTYSDRSDNKLYRLQTPQSPLVRPHMYDYFNMDNYPTGTNAIVAVISYTGYDMEDAMVKQNDGIFVFGVKPGDKRTTQKLDDDGLPFIGAVLEYGDPFYSYVNLNTGDSSIVYYKSKESCVVDNIKVCSNDNGTAMFKRVCITMRVPRNPTIGDKFASRHGQKGILSRLWPAEDMPFTESGMTPDILFNPHGFPSRMTIGMLIESMAGKSAAMHGLCHDATPFMFSEENSALEYFGKMLQAAGYNYYGTERIYSGISGMELEADIFIGVVYYQRLRHMVSDKFQVRTTGARDKVTNQPLGGRNVQGGIRFGEMERDALLAHGTSFLLQDRLFNCSDRSVAHVCIKCSSLLSPVLEKPPPSWSATRHRKYQCTLCHQSDTIEIVSVPYVFRYFVAELAAMNINIRLDWLGSSGKLGLSIMKGDVMAVFHVISYWAVLNGLFRMNSETLLCCYTTENVAINGTAVKNGDAQEARIRKATMNSHLALAVGDGYKHLCLSFVLIYWPASSVNAETLVSVVLAVALACQMTSKRRLLSP
eukprot:g47662.t1